MLLGCLLLAGCQALPAAEPPQPKAATITVSAAADLTYAFDEIGKQFEADTGNKVVFNYGSTGQLEQQIEKGAPVDVFAAANQSYVDDLENKGLILSDTKQLYARGRITLWTRADSPLQVTKLEDLTRPRSPASRSPIPTMRPTAWPRARPWRRRASGKRCSPSSCSARM